MKIPKTILFVGLFFASHLSDAQTITTIAGCGVGDDSVSTSAELFYPHNVAVDSFGNIFIAEEKGNRIRRVSRTSQIIKTIAGNGSIGYSGDGGLANTATLHNPGGIATDNKGNVFVADQGNNCIRKIDADGIITTYAGTGVAGYSGDGGLASLCQLNLPIGINFDRYNNLYIADAGNNCIRRIDNITGYITTYAGNGIAGFYGDSGLATSAELRAPYNVVIDCKGNVYFSDNFNNRVRKVDTAGIITTYAGNGSYAYSGDGGPAIAAETYNPNGLTVDNYGNVYFSDSHNFRVREVDTNGIITSIAGNGTAGYKGDGESADSAEFRAPAGLTIDKYGTLYISDTWNNRVRKLSTSGVITTFAGQSGLFEDNIPATSSELSVPSNIATDTDGNIYVADYYNNRVRIIYTDGTISTVAGNGKDGIPNPYSGDGAPADSAQILYPAAVAVDAMRNIYIADSYNSRIRKVNPSGIMTTIAGNGIAAFSGDGGPATNASINFPTGIAVDDSGNIYIADVGNAHIRKVSVTGIITTVAGNGILGFSGDGAVATSASIDPYDVAVDKKGNIFIADGPNNRIRKIDTLGIINTIAGDGSTGFSGDGGLATVAHLNVPAGIKTDQKGAVYFTDNNNERVRMIDTSGIINTIAGTGIQGFSGDGGMALLAKLNTPSGVALDKNGNIYIADGVNCRIRKITNSTLSINAPDKPKQFKVYFYPNPATNILTVYSSVAIVRISFVTLLGEKVKDLLFPRQEKYETIDIASLPAGIYLVKVNGVVEGKLVKE